MEITHTHWQKLPVPSPVRRINYIQFHHNYVSLGENRQEEEKVFSFVIFREF